MKFSQLQADTIFIRVWGAWPNKTGEANAAKAWDVFVKSGNNIIDFEKAAQAYLTDQVNTEPEFIYKLGNFIREDHWKDILEHTDVEKLAQKKANAYALMDAWNSKAKRHWMKVRDKDCRLGIAIKALENKSFAEDWRAALTKAEKLFKYPFREGDILSKLKISFIWFTHVSPAKHTVLDLLEGKFGEPEREEAPDKIIETKPIDYEARQEMAEEMKVLFPDVDFNKKQTALEKLALPPLVISEQARQLAEIITHKTKPHHGKKENDLKAHLNTITSSIPECSEDDDGFSLSPHTGG